MITAAGSSDVGFRLPLPAADPVRRRPSSIFSTADDRFSEMMVTLAGRRGSGGSAVSSEAGAGTAADAIELDDNGDIRWVIRTNTVQINRLPGQTLGMVVYSEKGKYGSRIDRVKRDGVAEAAGLRAEDIFVRLGDEVVIHCDHQQLVQKLLALPLCFTADVTESSQLPRAKGRYSIEMWSEAQRKGLENAALATFKASAQASVLETVQESPTRLRSSPTLWLTALSDDENEAAIAESCCSDDDDNLTLG
jgi:hypothetical protein